MANFRIGSAFFPGQPISTSCKAVAPVFERLAKMSPPRRKDVLNLLAKEYNLKISVKAILPEPKTIIN